MGIIIGLFFVYLQLQNDRVINVVAILYINHL